MPKTVIKAIIFDLGNVMVDFDLRPAVERIANFCSRTPDEIKKLFLDSNITSYFEKGKLSPEEFYSQAKEILGFKLGYESFVPIWNEIFFFSSKNRAVYHIANRLKKNYSLAILSNTNILHYRYIKDRFPIFNIFENVFLSFEIGSVKPDKVIYQKAIKALDCLPENIFYSDDRPELIKSALDLGIKSYVFTSPTQLIKDLSSLNIILADPQESYPPEVFLS